MPDFKKLITARVAALNLPAAQEASLVEELSQHLEDLYADSIAGGMSPEEALRFAVAEVDDLSSARAQLPQRYVLQHAPEPPGNPGRGVYLEQLFADLRYALRGMANHPMFAGFAVLTLALGIGANATVFTIVNTLLLNPLPVKSVSELMALATHETTKTSESRAALPLSFPNLKDYGLRNSVFASVAGYTSPRITTWSDGDTPQRIFVEFVTGNYFPTLGLQPARGRFFTEDESNQHGGHAVAVMNYASWQSKFGGDEKIVNRVLRLNNIAITVIGIAPPSFLGVNAIFGPDLWLPVGIADRVLPVDMAGVLTDRSKALFQGVGRLRPGTTRGQAEANLSTIAADLAREFPETNEGRTVSVKPVVAALLGETPTALASALLLVVAGIVLLIACSNVANLLLARSAARQGEIAIRLALGANRGRLLRQLLTESVVLGLLGGVAGALTGYEGAQLLWSFREPQWSANLVTPKFDSAVLLYTFVLSILTGLFFGAMPALRAYRSGVSATLKDEARTSGRNRNRVRFSNVLVTGQVAFSVVVLVAASLFLRSIEKAYQIDPGFNARHLGIVMTNPGQAGYTKAQVRAFYREVKERVAGMPGVESVSWSSTLPLWNGSVSGLEIEGREQRSRTDTVASVVHTVDADYFRTTGIRLVEGREFLVSDREESVPVAIVNEKLAHDYWPGKHALGKHIVLPGEKQRRQIVGIVANANYTSLGEAPQSAVYVALEQHPSDAMVLYFRTHGHPGSSLSAVQREIRRTGPQVSAEDGRTGSTILEQALMTSKLAVTLLSVFGSLALVLASIGLYGNLAFAVHRRRHEIGVRMALGADAGSVVGLVMKQGLVPVLIGLTFGLGLSLLTGRLLTNLLYGISASDPMSLALSTLVLLMVAAVACYVPARSASQVDPLITLRDV
jgi:predicted permease